MADPIDCWRMLPQNPAECYRNAIHVLRVSLASGRAAADQSWGELSPEEIARAKRYVVEPPRQRFRLCRRALRRALAWFTGTSPAQIEFGTERNGKPILLAPSGSDIAFNVSHTGDWGVIAVGWSRQLGVDIETSDPGLDCAGLADRFFSDAEQAELRSLPAAEQQAGFYRLWTSKEAYMKALGLGMLLPLGSFTMRADPRTEPSLLSGDIREGPWHSAGFQVADSVPGVVMWDRGPAMVRYWDAPEIW